MDRKPTLVPKGRYALKYRGTECTNCGRPLAIGDKYCPSCSQANSTKKLTLKDFFDEFFSTIISYDSKLVKTIAALILRPGSITKDYIEGKRVSYTNPFRFLLSLAIVYFLMINFTGNFSKLDRYGVNKENELPDQFDDLGNLNIAINANGEKVSLNKDLDSIKNSVGLKEFFKKMKERDSLILADPQPHFYAMEDSSFLKRFANKSEVFNTLVQNDSMANYEEGIDKYGISKSFENKMAFTAVSGYRKMRRQPGSFVSALISRLPFAIFFFLPIFSFFIWLAYIRKNYSYTDHLIFSFHNTALLFILLIISYLIDSVFNVNSNWIFVIIFSIYLFWAMRKFYRQGVFKTIVKYLFLNGIFFILAIVAIIVLSTGSIYTY